MRSSELRYARTAWRISAETERSASLALRARASASGEGMTAEIFGTVPLSAASDRCAVMRACWLYHLLSSVRPHEEDVRRKHARAREVRLTRIGGCAEHTVDHSDRTSGDCHSVAVQVDADPARSFRRLKPRERCPSKSASPKWGEDGM